MPSAPKRFVDFVHVASGAAVPPSGSVPLLDTPELPLDPPELLLDELLAAPLDDELDVLPSSSS